jgi:hypothetical protein
MSALFKRTKKQEGSTVLILDVENGSVGSALVRVSPHEAPKLFGEKRVHTPFLKSHAASSIVSEVERAAEAALAHAAEVAARVRVHASEPHGTISHTAVFLSPPWATMPTGFEELPHPISQRVYDSLITALGPGASVSFHPFATAGAHLVPSLYPHEERYLLCIVSGEVTELVAMQSTPYQRQLLGHATLPFGQNAILRTLNTHAGLTPVEALSALKLARHGTMSHLHEPLTSLAIHLAGEFEEVARELAAQGELRSVFVVGSEPTAEWVAKALAEHASLDTLFPQGGTVRAVRGSHISPYIAVHAPKPDIALLLEALFVDASQPQRLGAIR